MSQLKQIMWMCVLMLKLTLESCGSPLDSPNPEMSGSSPWLTLDLFSMSDRPQPESVRFNAWNMINKAAVLEHTVIYAAKRTDLVVEVVFEPAGEVCGVPSWSQTTPLQDLQLYRCFVGSRNDIMERVFQSHRVRMCSLMLKRKQLQLNIKVYKLIKRQYLYIWPDMPWKINIISTKYLIETL